jgi:hypothetical protein
MKDEAIKAKENSTTAKPIDMARAILNSAARFDRSDAILLEAPLAEFVPVFTLLVGRGPE